MTEITITYTFADRFLTPRELIRRVVAPTLCGLLFLCLMRYLLYAWPGGRYDTWTTSKCVATWLLISIAAGLIFVPLRRSRLVAKAHFLHVFFKPGSPVAILLSGTAIPTVASAIAAMCLAILSYIVIQTYSPFDIACIGAGCSLGLLLAQTLGYLLNDSLIAATSDLFLTRARHIALFACVTCGVVLATLWQDSASKWTNMDEDQVISQIEAEDSHPVTDIGNAIRILRYFDASVLRLRDGNGLPGWVLYICLLLPQAGPLVALTCLFLAFDAILSAFFSLHPTRGEKPQC